MTIVKEVTGPHSITHSDRLSTSSVSQHPTLARSPSAASTSNNRIGQPCQRQLIPDQWKLSFFILVSTLVLGYYFALDKAIRVNPLTWDDYDFKVVCEMTGRANAALASAWLAVWIPTMLLARLWTAVKDGLRR